ncbi:MAG: hypothetical protein Q7R77_01185 [Candidatus Daviesbacteria bacterium]|nr:hypothetical protein [Candidatus Daviesbacteria bacterium]
MKFLLLLIFLLAVVLRFLYFPQNTYFGFDQARDAYAVKEIIGGHFKITGPPTATGIINHGVLYYYIFTPFYLLANGDPAAVSAFLRILNAAGVFILFPIVTVMFGEIAAIFSVFLFAVSFEQTQFSLFLNHPSLAVISILVFYLGLAYWIFRKKIWGLYIVLLGLGFSIQFEFVETQLIAIFLLFILFFRKKLPKLTIKNIIISVLLFILPVSSFIISEIKNNFIIIKNAPDGMGSASSLSQFVFIITRHIHDNLIANNIGAIIIGLILLVSLVTLILKRMHTDQTIFLIFWFFGGLLVYFFTSNDAYFYNTGTGIALLIFAGFILSKIFSTNKFLTLVILILIIISNMYLITKNNPLGPNQKINPQIGLLIEDEKRVIDYIYQKANKDNFAVNALTMPYNVNTTWSYLFEWYGKGKYGYVPVWGGDAALGFPGNLKVETARSELPAKRFLIIEPLEGIPTYTSDAFIKNEQSYSEVLEKKKFGTIEVWVQKAK